MYLRDCDAALPGQLLLGLLCRVRVRQVGVEVLVQDLARLLVEVPPLASGVQEPGAQDHYRLAGRLLQLDLDGVELLVDDLHHPLNLLGSDRTCPGLLSQQIHDMSCELLTSGVIPEKRERDENRERERDVRKKGCLFGIFLLFKLLVVDVPNLVEFGFVLAVHDRCVGILEN